MLQSLSSAFDNCGKSKASIGRDIGRSAQTVYGWCSGRFYVPPRCRPLIDASIGVNIDWEKYDAEFAARIVQSDPAPDDLPPPAPMPPPAPVPPRPAPPPAMPRPAPQRPATAPRRITATPPAHQTQQAPTGRSGGFWGMFRPDPNDNGMKFE